MPKYFNLLKYAAPTPTIKDEVKDLIGVALVSKYKEHGIEYNPDLHSFVIAKQRRKPQVIEFLSKQPDANILNVLNKFRQEVLSDYAEKIRELYEELAKRNVSEREFSYICQSATSGASEKYNDGELRSVIDKVGIEILHAYQLKIRNVIAALTSTKEQPLKEIFSGKIADEFKPYLSRPHESKLLYDFLSENFKPYTKDELLFEADFSQTRFPLSITRYWPLVTSEKGRAEILDKIRLNIDIESPNEIGEAIKAAIVDANVTSPEQNRIKYLFLSQFGKNIDKFLNFIAQAYSNEYSPDFLEEFKGKVRDSIEGGRKERLKDDLFEGYSVNFDSMKEKEVVYLIRDEFELQCVPSNMQFPKTSDFQLNKFAFIIDFVIYCDVYEGNNIIEVNGEEHEVPDIKSQVIIVGEYYGFGGDKIVKVLDTDLINPDGSLAYPKGHSLNATEAYGYKTQYKKITESFCAGAIGCKTISIGKAESRKNQIREIVNGLTANSVIYNTKSIRLPDQSALKRLMAWYSSADDISRKESEATLNKYFDTRTLKAKQGRDFKFNPYESIIESTRKNIEAQELRLAIERNKQNYNTPFIMSERGREFRQHLITERAKYGKDNGWRFKKLDELNGFMKQNVQPINTKNFVEYLRVVQDPAAVEPMVPQFSFFLRKAFNLKNFLKRAEFDNKGNIE